MREVFNNEQEAQLRRQYRKLIMEAQRLSEVNPTLADEYHVEAEKIVNKLAIIQRQKRTSFTGNIRFA